MGTYLCGQREERPIKKKRRVDEMGNGKKRTKKEKKHKKRTKKRRDRSTIYAAHRKARYSKTSMSSIYCLVIGFNADINWVLNLNICVCVFVQLFNICILGTRCNSYIFQHKHRY